MTDAPFFSVIVPTHVRPLLLARALQSLRAQTFAHFETIVVADALDEASAAVVARLIGPSDTFIKRSGAPGPAASRNLGLDLARGAWVVFLDDDDRFEPHHLQTLRAHVARIPDALALFSDCDVATEDRLQAGMPELSRQTLALTSRDTFGLWIKNFIPNHALAYRRSAIDGCRFDPHLASHEDWDFLLAVCTRAMPEPYAGGGAVMYKDFQNPGLRRGTQQAANDSTVILDYLHIYRRWPAPTAELKAQRQTLLKGAGLNLPVEWF